MGSARDSGGAASMLWGGTDGLRAAAVAAAERPAVDAPTGGDATSAAVRLASRGSSAAGSLASSLDGSRCSAEQALDGRAERGTEAGLDGGGMSKFQLGGMSKFQLGGGGAPVAVSTHAATNDDGEGGAANEFGHAGRAGGAAYGSPALCTGGESHNADLRDLVHTPSWRLEATKAALGAERADEWTTGGTMADGPRRLSRIAQIMQGCAGRGRFGISAYSSDESGGASSDESEGHAGC
eukprot:6916546-Prymnesium_polylepis.1